MINRAVACMLNGRLEQQAKAEPTPKPNEAKQPSDVQKQCNKHKQTQADQANTHATTKATTSRSRGEHKQKQRETQAEKWEAQAGTRRNTSRNNEEHKEKTQAGTRRNPSRNKEKHKPKQGETHAKIEGSTSRNRGTH